jgi:hypothetical protein
MTRRTCERESSVAAAARSGQWPADLEDHLAACAVCTETKRVAELFLQHAAGISRQNQPSAANVVWQRIQAQRQQLALKRARQCVTLMSVLAGVYAAVLAAWYLPRLWHPQLSTDFSALSSGVVLTGVLTAIAAVLIGSCCLVLLGRRTDFRLHT